LLPVYATPAKFVAGGNDTGNHTMLTRAAGYEKKISSQLSHENKLLDIDFHSETTVLLVMTSFLSPGFSKQVDI
jgi:hypothetical protein